jgi:dihydrodipicolinate synthase/N-acetylneuraminate lyase
MSGAVPMMVVMPLAIGAIAAQAWMGVATWVSVLAFVVAAVLVVVWRAWRMKDAPSAFPAGRLSQP